MKFTEIFCQIIFLRELIKFFPIKILNIIRELGLEFITLVELYKCDYSFIYFINNNNISESLCFLKKTYHIEDIKPILVNHLINQIFKEETRKTKNKYGIFFIEIWKLMNTETSQFYLNFNAFFKKLDLFLFKTNGIPRTTRFWSKETNILKEKCSEMHFILYYILEHPFPFFWPVLILGSICTCSKLVFFLKPVCLYLLTYFGWGNWGISLESWGIKWRHQQGEHKTWK